MVRAHHQDDIPLFQAEVAEADAEPLDIEEELGGGEGRGGVGGVVEDWGRVRP